MSSGSFSRIYYSTVVNNSKSLKLLSNFSYDPCYIIGQFIQTLQSKYGYNWRIGIKSKNKRYPKFTNLLSTWHTFGFITFCLNLLIYFKKIYDSHGIHKLAVLTTLPMYAIGSSPIWYLAIALIGKISRYPAVTTNLTYGTLFSLIFTSTEVNRGIRTNNQSNHSINEESDSESAVHSSLQHDRNEEEAKDLVDQEQPQDQQNDSQRGIDNLHNKPNGDDVNSNNSIHQQNGNEEEEDTHSISDLNDHNNNENSDTENENTRLTFDNSLNLNENNKINVSLLEPVAEHSVSHSLNFNDTIHVNNNSVKNNQIKHTYNNTSLEPDHQEREKSTTKSLSVSKIVDELNLDNKNPNTNNNNYKNTRILPDVTEKTREDAKRSIENKNNLKEKDKPKDFWDKLKFW